jgi:transposase-like protein
MTATDPHTPADDLWAIAREAYLSGATGSLVCREFDLAPSTFWRRAAAEGWLRRDAPAPAPEPFDQDAPVETAAASRDTAWRTFSRAMAQGRVAEAERWLRLHETLTELARREAAAARAADPISQAMRRRVEEARQASYGHYVDDNAG